MSYTDFNTHFVEQFHHDEIESRIHYCKTVLKRECDTCSDENSWCELHRGHTPKPKEEEVTNGL